MKPISEHEWSKVTQADRNLWNMMFKKRNRRRWRRMSYWRNTMLRRLDMILHKVKDGGYEDI